MSEAWDQCFCQRLRHARLWWSALSECFIWELWESNRNKNWPSERVIRSATAPDKKQHRLHHRPILPYYKQINCTHTHTHTLSASTPTHPHTLAPFPPLNERGGLWREEEANETEGAQRRTSLKPADLGSAPHLLGLLRPPYSDLEAPEKKELLNRLIGFLTKREHRE